MAYLLSLIFAFRYVQENPELDHSDPNYNYFSRVFEAFKISEGGDETTPAAAKKDEPGSDSATSNKAMFDSKMFEDEEAKKEEEQPKFSKRKLKLLTRPTVAQLKAVKFNDMLCGYKIIN